MWFIGLGSVFIERRLFQLYANNTEAELGLGLPFRINFGNHTQNE